MVTLQPGQVRIFSVLLSRLVLKSSAGLRLLWRHFPALNKSDCDLKLDSGIHQKWLQSSVHRSKVTGQSCSDVALTRAFFSLNEKLLSLFWRISAALRPLIGSSLGRSCDGAATGCFGVFFIIP